MAHDRGSVIYSIGRKILSLGRQSFWSAKVPFNKRRAHLTVTSPVTWHMVCGVKKTHELCDDQFVETDNVQRQCLKPLSEEFVQEMHEDS